MSRWGVSDANNYKTNPLCQPEGGLAGFVNRMSDLLCGHRGATLEEINSRVEFLVELEKGCAALERSNQALEIINDARERLEDLLE